MSSTTAIQQHALPSCRQDDGTYKRSHATKETAESFEREMRERFPENEEQRAYECPERGSVNAAHWHLTKIGGDNLEDRTSALYAQRSLPILPDYPEEEGKRGRRSGSTSHVGARREKVLNALNANPDTTYESIAAGLGIDKNLFLSDVQILRNSGRYEGRQKGRIADSQPYRSGPPKTAAQKLDELENTYAKERKELLAQVQAEEEARIERERVRYSWIAQPAGEEVLEVVKNGQRFVTSFEGWEEVCKAVRGALEKKRELANAHT